MRAAVLGFPALVAACVSTPDRSYPVYMFEGSADALEQLAQAARTCGFGDVQLMIGGAHLHILSVSIPARADPRRDCTMRWISEHPETGFTVPAGL
ncbi:hypothetical protein [Sphingosinicella sp. YJ22]|uniref:hypothetical protein n=1 Tax=Sphingosinicella sp. YJ22 TaxID=1104780 RepID=UPI00140B783D|nr:hypothetical protein [Sphingosinicella sp. YJ22]